VTSRSPGDSIGDCLRSEHEFEKSRMDRSWSTGSHAWWRDRRGPKEDEEEKAVAANVTSPPCHPSAFAFAPSFACQSTLASNFLHAIARYWNCLVGDLSPSVIYFLNRSYLPACLTSPTRPSVTSYGRPSCARVCEHMRLRGTRNFPIAEVNSWGILLNGVSILLLEFHAIRFQHTTISNFLRIKTL